MRTRATLSGIFASVAILVVGWQAGSAAVTAANTTTSSTTNTGTSAATGTTSTGTGAASSPTPAPAASSASAPATTAVSGSFTGSSVDTRFGSVQVQVVVANGTITDVKALHLTDDGGRSVQISNYAAPILRSEVLKSQSAKVSTVGGATYTSEAYLTSLQSALDRAGI